MRKSILQNMLFVVALSLCLLLVFAALVFDLRITANTKETLLSTASALALAYDPEKPVQEQIVAMDKATGVNRVTIIGADGTPLADSQVDASKMENHADREEIKLARAARSGVSVRASETIGSKLVYAAVKTSDGSYVRIAKLQGGYLYDILSLLPWLLLASALSLVLAMPVAKRLSRSLSRPLIELGASLKTVKDGETTLDVESYKYSELQDMASDINEISHEISTSLLRLEGERRRINYILDNMHEGFVMLDNADSVLMINTAACVAFGCEQSAVIGKNMLHATRNVPLLDAITAARLSQKHCAVSLSLPQAREGEANISTVQPEGGVIIIISDVTESKNAAKMRQEFFQSASHELKTPITSIQGFAELLGGTKLDDAQVRDIHKRIGKETARMTTLINDIIMISRLESGDMFFEKELLDVGAVISEICADARLLAQQNNITINCETQSAVRSISRRELSELAGNLVQNAVKYNVTNGEVNVKLDSSGGTLSLRVFNTGEPIPHEFRARVFERFFRIDKGRSKAAGGTGLGLAIVKHIAQRLGATVSLDVNANGNTFTVVLPKEN